MDEGKKREAVVNPIPVPTWNWLKMNEAVVRTDAQPDGEIRPAVSGVGSGIIYRAAPAAPFSGATGLGGGASVFFADAGKNGVALTAERDARNSAPVVLSYDWKDGGSAACTQIVRAEENSSLTVIVVSRSPRDAAGFSAMRTKLCAARNAHIHLVKVQLLGGGFVQLDDTSAVCSDGGTVEVTHVILGGAETYVGVAAALSGFQSSFSSDTAYLCSGGQLLDMNYIVTHTGKRTSSSMAVDGTLCGRARKTYRGTIDFQNGCSGAVGEEQEEVLLLSPDAVNKSIPLILCGEEDVSGEHGATIGRLSEEMLFYMQARGIGRQAAERLVARAKIQRALSRIPDEGTAAAVQQCLDGAFGDHEPLL
ncbi:MAG: SufD family Fe-S cluster assembly protein [Treponemataceae bacterium]|nr:SufD family Fe-S cluster assembly protein [Treponemataceae bacterium]